MTAGLTSPLEHDAATAAQRADWQITNLTCRVRAADTATETETMAIPGHRMVEMETFELIQRRAHASRRSAITPCSQQTTKSPKSFGSGGILIVNSITGQLGAGQLPACLGNGGTDRESPWLRPASCPVPALPPRTWIHVVLVIGPQAGAWR